MTINYIYGKIIRLSTKGQRLQLENWTERLKRVCPWKESESSREATKVEQEYSIVLISLKSKIRTKISKKTLSVIKNLRYLTQEFDPGSGRTLAACLTHASRTDYRKSSDTKKIVSGERVSNAWATCLVHWDNREKFLLIPDMTTEGHPSGVKANKWYKMGSRPIS